jgi:hypothetical protein
MGSPMDDHRMGGDSMKPIHPEGRLLAIHQQIFFAGLLGDKMQLDQEVILRKLAMTGLSLSLDTNEIAVDAASVAPALDKYKAHKLQAVPDMGDDQ